MLLVFRKQVAIQWKLSASRAFLQVFVPLESDKFSSNVVQPYAFSHDLE
jgi:hypothetical protein